jgi:putative addiction module killer protein
VLIEVRRYVTANGKDVFGDWLSGLKDARTRAMVAVRVARLAAGNFGDCKPLRDGVWELRINWGPGYRVYYAMIERTCVLLLCGGDKRKQAADIQKAVEYWNDYQQRNGPS